jgi:hypothetical protein
MRDYVVGICDWRPSQQHRIKDKVMSYLNLNRAEAVDVALTILNIAVD